MSSKDAGTTSPLKREGDSLWKWLHKHAATLAQGMPGLYNDLFQVVMALASVGVYVATCYIKLVPLPPWVFAVEVLFCIVFCVDYVWSLLAAEKKIHFALSQPSIVDLLSIVPIITLPRLISGEPGVTLEFCRVFRLFRAIRLLEAAAGGYHGSNPDGSIRRQIAILVAHVTAYVLVSAGLVHAVQRMAPLSFRTPTTDFCEDTAEQLGMIPPALWPESCSMSLFTALYFSLITALTVGYGDIYPTTEWSRLVSLSVLLPLFIIVPHQASRLLTLLQNVSRYTRKYPGSAHGHVIVCGDLTGHVVYALLSEFFHTDHGQQRMRVVLMDAREPDAVIKAALDDPRFDQRVQYIRGNALTTADLAKAAVHEARAVFIISTAARADAVLSDATALLTVRIVKTSAPWCPVFCQLLSPASTIHEWADWDSLVCSQELKYALLAKSAVCPGFGTLIANLLTSSSSTASVDLSLVEPGERQWLHEYLRGSSQELYCMPFATAFHNMFFHEAAHIAYLLFGVILIGVETQRTRRRNSVDALLSNPDTSPEERARKLAERQAQLLGLNRSDQDDRASLDDDTAEARYHRLLRERKKRADAVLLINPRDYCIREGDVACIIAEDFYIAHRVSEFDGTYPPEKMHFATISPTDKRTFRRMNGGRGPLLRMAQPVSAAPRVSTQFHISPQRFACESIVQRIVPPEGHDESHSCDTPRPSHESRSAELASTAHHDGVWDEDYTHVDDEHEVEQHALRAVHPLELLAYPARVLDDAHAFRGHVVVCGPGVSNKLPEVVMPLCMNTHAIILVLYPLTGGEEEARDILSQIDAPPDKVARVFFVNGSSINHHDLLRAGIATAAVALIVAGNNNDFEGAEAGGGDALTDASASAVASVSDVETLFTVCVIESKFPSCRVLVEVPDAASMRYLAYKPQDDSLPRQLWPQFASGRVHVASTLGNLLVQSYYNPSLIPILSKLVDPSGQAVVAKHIIEPKINVFSQDDTDEEAKRRASLLQSAVGLHGGNNAPEAAADELELRHRLPENGHTLQMKVPAAFVNRKFGDLFMELVLTRNILPLGVYRSPAANGAPLPYVVTNPSPKMRLHPDDKIFVLCPPSLAPSAEAPLSWSSPGSTTAPA